MAVLRGSQLLHVPAPCQPPASMHLPCELPLEQPPGTFLPL